MAGASVASAQNDGGEDRSHAILAIMASLNAITVVFVTARLFVRIKLLRNAGLDDYLIVAAMICSFVNLGISTAAIKSGSGRHFNTLSLEEKSGVIKYTIASFCPGILSFGIPKLAVVALLTKLTEPSRQHRTILWLSSIATLLLLFGCVIILYAQCTPSRSQWDFSVEGTCWSPWVLVNYAIVAGAVSAFMDLYLAVYPATVLAKLQMSIKKKFAFSVALGIGAVGGIVAAYKCTRLPGLAEEDFSWTTSELVIWTCAEGCAIIIAACIPIMQPLVKMIFRSSTPSHTPYRSHYNTPDVQLSSDLSKLNNGRYRANVSARHPTESGSQESILGEEKRRTASPTRVGNVFSHGKIKRVDEVTVTSKSAAAES
ncbi:hypothetical protein D0864_05278 [Hortaea werneckii]|uniref:Rhodopsin domain-containing protein n=1 Tax=Hortaea werneckii TaxID=91943 RepID=A0A3M7G3P9_HORWE|nr:hypothetical protein D0864_05278 [Hortaea werneckii]